MTDYTDIINQLLETEEDDFGDADLVKDTESFSQFNEVSEWLANNLPKLGFAPDGHRRWWIKVTANEDRRVKIGVSTEEGKTFMVLYLPNGPSWYSEKMEVVDSGKPVIDKLREWGVLSVTESEFEDEDEDSFLIRDTETITPSEVEAGLARAGFEKENDVWVKRKKQRAITVSLVSNGYYVINCYRRSENGWVFTHRWDSNLTGMEEYINRFKGNEIEEAEEEDFGDEDEAAFEMKDVLGPEDKHEIYTFVKTGRIEITGSVRRHSNHYVHENTTSVELNVDYPLPYNPTEQQVEDHAFVQSKMEPEIDRLEKEINEDLRGWNKKIYQELEAAYDDYTSDEQVAETIRANDYTFDEDGNINDGEIMYAQLSPEAQQKAREWWVQTTLENGDNYYSESVIAEWKWLLKNKGFNNVEISFSGFWSQGDGASFTAKSIDIEKYLTGPDPLTFPEPERDQLWESEEDDDLDLSDVYSPDRKSIAHLATKADYAEYEQRVKEFFARQHINSLSPVSDEDGNWISHGFRKSPCDVCHRPLAGERVEASGFNPDTKEVQVYDNVCQDCLYYSEYGQLDDQTMMDLKDNPVTEAEEENLDDDVDFKDVEIDNPTHNMPVGRDKIHSQPATQYYEKFPNNAWEIYVVRPAKPTKKDPRDYRSVFIGILIRTAEGWHQINRNNDSWVGRAYQTPSEPVQIMFDSNKEYVWRGLASN